MWFIVYNQTTGAMVSIASEGNVASPLPEGLAVVPYETQPDLTANTWDPVQRMLVPRVIVPRRTVSKRGFMGRIPVEHLIALNAIRIDPAAPVQLKAVLNTAAELRDMVTDIDLDDPATQQFVPVATDALIGLGLVQAEDRENYIAVWLASPA